MEKIKAVWEKLKREWKTFTVAIAGFLVFAWDAVVAQGFDLTSVVAEKYRALVGLVFMGLMLVLRKYTDPKTEDDE